MGLWGKKGERKTIENIKIQKKNKEKYIDIVTSLYIKGSNPTPHFDVPMLVTDSVCFDLVRVWSS